MVAKAVDELAVCAISIFLMATRYHTMARLMEEELRLKMDLQDMGMRLHQLGAVVDAAMDLRACIAAIAELRKAITGQHFEDEHIAALGSGSPQIAEIVDAYLRLKRSLFALKIGQFPR